MTGFVFIYFGSVLVICHLTYADVMHEAGHVDSISRTLFDNYTSVHFGLLHLIHILLLAIAPHEEFISL